MENNPKLCPVDENCEEGSGEKSAGEDEKVLGPKADKEVDQGATKKPVKNVRFSDFVTVEPADDYDRSGSLHVTLTPLERFYVRQELNYFKQTEMVVHADSVGNTRYHSLI